MASTSNRVRNTAAVTKKAASNGSLNRASIVQGSISASSADSNNQAPATAGEVQSQLTYLVDSQSRTRSLITQLEEALAGVTRSEPEEGGEGVAYPAMSTVLGGSIQDTHIAQERFNMRLASILDRLEL